MSEHETLRLFRPVGQMQLRSSERRRTNGIMISGVAAGTVDSIYG